MNTYANNIILYNDDCMNILKTIENGSIDLICTDPPYPVTARGNAGNSGGMLQKKVNRDGKVYIDELVLGKLFVSSSSGFGLLN